MTNATKRSLLRWVHLVLSIPILGYIYGPMEQVQQYAAPVRFIFVPVVLLSGLWMYAGIIFAILGVALWIAAFQLSGFGTAVLSQVILFVTRKVWFVMQKRPSKRIASPTA